MIALASKARLHEVDMSTLAANPRKLSTHAIPERIEVVQFATKCIAESLVQPDPTT